MEAYELKITGTKKNHYLATPESRLELVTSTSWEVENDQFKDQIGRYEPYNTVKESTSQSTKNLATPKLNYSKQEGQKETKTSLKQSLLDYCLEVQNASARKQLTSMEYGVYDIDLKDVRSDRCRSCRNFMISEGHAFCIRLKNGNGYETDNRE